jgi:hypothetical protein
VRSHACDYPGGESEHHGDDRCDERELERYAERADAYRGDRFSVVRDGFAEVALHEAEQEPAVLREERFVEVVIGADAGDVFRRRGLRRKQGHRVAGRDVDKKEGNERHADDDRNGVKDSPDDKRSHGMFPLSFSLP